MTDDFSSFSGTSFVSNGLLVEAPFVPNGLLDVDMSQNSMQDESLPSLSQLFPSRSNDPSASSTRLSTSVGFAASTSDSRAGAPLCSFSHATIEATSFDGKSVFFARRKPTETDVALGHSSGSDVNMLEVPIHRLMEQLSATTATRLAQANYLTTNISNNVHHIQSNNGLWVDRYRPQRFLDLLGDERVQRETLSWVKEWDFCVFGKKKPNGKQRVTTNGTNRDYNHEDEYYRPRERILLLSGPPGLGKTTLAHVIAAQAGYQAMEINASDTRSGQVVDDRIRPALESGAAVGSKKPVLLIVDEIDGATGGGEHTSSFVQKLLQLTFDRPNRKTRANDHRGRPLLRPIIAICNDLYASSLARLRQHARVVRFNRPADIRLVKRLRDICEIENMRADSRALSTLVGIAQGDMRGCLNTLQFIKSNNQEVTESAIRSATAGMKEGDTSLLSVLGDLFSPLSKRKVRELGLTEREEARYVGRLSRDAEASGSLDKLMMGCFEHYLNLHVHDATLKRYEDAHEWLSIFDVFSGMMRSEKEYASMTYLPYFIVPFYSLFAERGSPRPERPKADWENFMKTKTNQEIYNTIAKAGTPGQGFGTKKIIHYRHFTTGDVLRLEFLPLLNRIISPPLRPVNSHLVRPEEKALMKRLVEIMVSLELRFVQERAEDGALMYRLDPPIDVFVTYDGKRSSDIIVSRYAVRHLVAAEIDAELILRQAEVVERGETNKHDFFRGRKESGADDLLWNPAGDGEGKLVGRLEVPQKEKHPERKVDPADKTPVDFFGRPIALPVSNVSVQIAYAEPAAKKCKVKYRFKEGNSSAVRKPVKIEALL